MQKHGLRVVFAAIISAVGLMAFSASAQAILVSHHEIILINGEALAKGTVKTLSGTQEGSGTLSIPAKASEIVCEKGEIISATAENETDTQEGPANVPIKKLTAKSESGLAAMAQGKVEYSGCKVFTFKLEGEKKIELKESAPCTKAFNEKNKNPSGVAGRPVADILILTFLHLDASGLVERLIVRITQLSEIPFSTLEFGGTCLLPEKLQVTGGFSGEIPMPTAEGKTLSVKFESETTKGKELNAISETKILFGASEAFLESKVNLELPGNAKWGVM